MKLITQVLLVATLFMVQAAMAATVVTESDGSVRLENLEDDITYTRDIPFDKGALAYGDTWKRAFTNPGFSYQ